MLVIIKTMKKTSQQNWDQSLSQLDGHLYQSSLWLKFQQAQGREVFQDQGDGWLWMGAIRKSALKISYLYVAYGPTARDEAALKKSLASIKHHAEAAGVVFVRIDIIKNFSSSKLKAMGLVPRPDMQPKYRMVLDIDKSADELWMGVSQSARSYINSAKKRGIEFEISENPADLNIFLKMQAITAQRQGIRNHPDSYYEHLLSALIPTGACKLYFARTKDQYIASALCIDWGKTRYYAYAATDDELNRTTRGATVLLWWLIENAKTTGLKRFDYGGVVPLDWDSHPWIGHTRFKSRFGGEIIEGSGTWDLPINKPKYSFYRLAKRFNKK